MDTHQVLHETGICGSYNYKVQRCVCVCVRVCVRARVRVLIVSVWM